MRHGVRHRHMRDCPNVARRKSLDTHSDSHRPHVGRNEPQINADKRGCSARLAESPFKYRRSSAVNPLWPLAANVKKRKTHWARNRPPTINPAVAASQSPPARLFILCRNLSVRTQFSRTAVIRYGIMHSPATRSFTDIHGKERVSMPHLLRFPPCVPGWKCL
jgi:hypothetical protein